MEVQKDVTSENTLNHAAELNQIYRWSTSDMTGVKKKLSSAEGMQWLSNYVTILKLRLNTITYGRNAINNTISA